ncbi:Crp/Fnr family transcriptional regulator [Marinobacter pelagius]|uniref:Crp/Fnr family transcriptional regulator n=1 Tax=Marinobacter sp. C7 TaxID=2951363 RepID=UPI001EEFEAF3|nr:Crp/Fnr family transcriptional regulator [Marinobacter sp. C7]MCG7200287.1 Crp/Fnr family transcriptional regulator [Marinobacter sp. C7]
MPVTEPSWSVRELVALCDQSSRFAGGELVTKFNENPGALYVVGSGAAKSFYYDADGNERITAFYLPGEVFGLEGLNRNNLSIANKMLVTGHLFRIPFSQLFYLLSRDIQFSKYLVELLSYETFDARRMSIINGHYTAEVRLAYFLLNLWTRLKAQCHQDHVLTLPMTRIEIGNFLGLTPETISRCLALFKKNNWIESRGRKIKLVDMDSLTQLVTGTSAWNSRHIKSLCGKTAA